MHTKIAQLFGQPYDQLDDRDDFEALEPVSLATHGALVMEQAATDSVHGSQPLASDVARVRKALSSTRTTTAFIRAIAKVYRDEYNDPNGAAKLEDFAESFWTYERDTF